MKKTTKKKEERKNDNHVDRTITKREISKQVDVASLRLFVKKFRVISLPVVLRPLSPDKNFKNAPFTDIENDSVDRNILFENNVGLYGLLPDTSRYYAFITLIPADVMAPFLTIYSKTGEELGRTSLFVHGCTYGPDILLCSATGRINKDLTIECVDSIKTVEIDDKADPIKGTEKLFVRTKKGRIHNNGKLEMGEEKENIHNPSTYGWTE